MTTLKMGGWVPLVWWSQVSVQFDLRRKVRIFLSMAHTSCSKSCAVLLFSWVIIVIPEQVDDLQCLSGRCLISLDYHVLPHS